jgi:hypothetical protein
MNILNLLLATTLSAAPEAGFVDMTNAAGLGPEVIPETVARLCFADLNDDGRPDIVVDRHRVFLNEPDASSPLGLRFVEVPPERSGLRIPVEGTLTVFADLDNDGSLDAICTEYINHHVESWTDHGRRTSWQRGNGDGTFGPPQQITGAFPATTSAVAVGDVDRNGSLDLWLGNWYMQYGTSLAGFPNQLLYSAVSKSDDGATHIDWRYSFIPWIGRSPTKQPTLDQPFDDETDAAGRPTYGAMIADLNRGGRPELIELNYGRRWNRCWVWNRAMYENGLMPWLDFSSAGFDGDRIRHGEYPEWLKERAKTDPRFEREDEKPFRANGNSFDCAVGDVDNDGDFDVLVTEIAHGWAGESSDRSRILFNGYAQTEELSFIPDGRYSLDRIPPEKNNWNQGDLFGELADLDHDGLLDVILSSGDYPDDQRLRVFLQVPDGGLRDATESLGIDHDGSQQISLADVDGDGDLDILAGRTFFRYSADQRAGRSPHPKLLINNATEGRKSLTLRLDGGGGIVNRDALGAVVRATVADGTTMMRQLVGIGGHAGKQNDFLVHFGLGDADRITELTVEWPDPDGTKQVFEDVAAGAYTLQYKGELKPVVR